MKKSMIKITSGYGNEPTFKLIPFHEDCCFLEAVFNPMAKMLSVVSKVKYEGFQFLFKLDSNGQKIPLPGGKQPKGQAPLYQQERLRIDHFYEYLIAERPEIEAFVEMMTENVKAADIADYFKVAVPPVGNVPGPVVENKKSKLEIVKDKKEDGGAETN